jgi:hypothetical protein
LHAQLTQLLIRHGILDNGNEEIKDIGVIVGGTSDQPIHRDIAKPSKASVEEYNQWMSLPNCPASVLVGMGGNLYPTRLGIAKVQFNEEAASGQVRCWCLVYFCLCPAQLVVFV